MISASRCRAGHLPGGKVLERPVIRADRQAAGSFAEPPLIESLEKALLLRCCPRSSRIRPSAASLRPDRSASSQRSTSRATARSYFSEVFAAISVSTSRQVSASRPARLVEIPGSLFGVLSLETVPLRLVALGLRSLILLVPDVASGEQLSDRSSLGAVGSRTLGPGRFQESLE